MKGDNQKKKVQKFLIFSILGLLVINIPLISAYILLVKFGTFTLYPGEHYTLNIPFISPSLFSTICGVAEFTNGTVLKGINITLIDYDTNISINKSTTDNNGNFCFSILNLTSNNGKKFSVFIGYDNATLTLGSNDYDLNLDDGKVYSRGSTDIITLTGDITNKDAPIVDGRFEIKMGYKNGTWKYIFGGYQKYLLNINSNTVYELQTDDLNLPWNISQLENGEYKFLIKTSFNGKEYDYNHAGNTIYFNITN